MKTEYKLRKNDGKSTVMSVFDLIDIHNDEEQDSNLFTVTWTQSGHTFEEYLPDFIDSLSFSFK